MALKVKGVRSQGHRVSWFQGFMVAMIAMVSIVAGFQGNRVAIAWSQGHNGSMVARLQFCKVAIVKLLNWYIVKLLKTYNNNSTIDQFTN